jgi:ABC-type transport system involved in multi-copper enzyme maturation permease subunit
MGIFSDNPVLQREVRGRLRLRRLGMNRALLGTLGLLALTILYFYARSLSGIWNGQPQDAREFWSLIVYGLLVLIVLLAPALSSTAITQEREQQTWEALTTTRLTAGEVLLGKWLARQMPLGLLALIALPLLIGCMIRGAVGLPLTLAALLFLALTTGLFGALGLTCSFLVRRTSMATAAALSATAFLCLGTAVIDALIESFQVPHVGETAVLWVNPFYALAALIGGMRPDQDSLTPRVSGEHAPFLIVTVYLILLLCAVTLCLAGMITRYRSAVRER